jgi:hypothetical protein
MNDSKYKGAFEKYHHEMMDFKHETLLPKFFMLFGFEVCHIGKNIFKKINIINDGLLLKKIYYHHVTLFSKNWPEAKSISIKLKSLCLKNGFFGFTIF